MTIYFTIQSIAWETGLQAVKDSISFATFEEFIQHLQDSIPQNSATVRRRYGNLIVKRLFPEHSIDGLLSRVWRSYHDETILNDLARVSTLEAEPVIARFVIEQLLVVPPGTIIEPASIRDFISAVFGSYKHDSYGRLQSALKHMGLVSRVNGQLITQAVPRPSDAFLILMHARLAPTPRIVRVSDILAQMPPANDSSQTRPYPFWRELGMREESDVRAILRDAEAAGLIARYAVVDQLEQITTRYTFDDYLAGAHRL